MTGPEHYRKAEQLLDEVVGSDGSLMTDDADRLLANTIAAAQAHATLALTAATAYPAVVAYCGDESGESRAWSAATS